MGRAELITGANAALKQEHDATTAYELHIAAAELFAACVNPKTKKVYRPVFQKAIFAFNKYHKLLTVFENKKEFGALIKILEPLTDAEIVELWGLIFTIEKWGSRPTPERVRIETSFNEQFGEDRWPILFRWFEKKSELLLKNIRPKIYS